MTPRPRSPRSTVRSFRLAAALFFVGGVILVFAGFEEEEPGLLLTGLLQLAAWLLFARAANRRELGTDAPRTPMA